MTPPSGPPSTTPAGTTRPPRRRLSSRTDAAAAAAIPPAQDPTPPEPRAEDPSAVSLFEQWRRATRTITDLYGSVYEGRRTYHGYMPGCR